MDDLISFYYLHMNVDQYDNMKLSNLSLYYAINPLAPSGHYNGRTAQLTSRHFILNIYSTNIRTEYFKHVA